MASDSSPPREGVIARIRESSAAQLWIVAAASVVFFLVFKIAGILGDCGPHDHDGQCGMGAFVAELFGAFGAIVIWIGLSAQILWARRRRERRRRRQRLRGDGSVDAMTDHAASLFQNRLDDDARREGPRAKG